jgi:glycyl-tRNA synthetase beta chain
VAEAVGQQYLPRGAGDSVPGEPVAIALGLADRIDQLAGFFSAGEKPTGSGDPYALRRAALGVIRLVLDNRLRLDLRAHLAEAAGLFDPPADADELLGFIAERLRVQLRAEGARHDVLSAILAGGVDPDLSRLIARTTAVAAFLASEAGANLLAGYKRAANILRIEDKKDGPHEGEHDPEAAVLPQERALVAALGTAGPDVRACLAREDYTGAMSAMAGLRGPLDDFFTSVTVNDPEPKLRRNRLLLLRAVRQTMHVVADFSRIEG